MKYLYGLASQSVSWSPTTNEGILNGVWWRREVGREATCPPTTSQSCLLGLDQLEHTNPTEGNEEMKERKKKQQLLQYQHVQYDRGFRLTAVFL